MRARVRRARRHAGAGKTSTPRGGRHLGARVNLPGPGGGLRKPPNRAANGANLPSSPRCSGCAASHWTAKLRTTSLASRRDPSSNRTPRRRWHVQTVSAAFGSQLVASAGNGPRSARREGVQPLDDLASRRGPRPGSIVVGAVQPVRLGRGQPDELTSIARGHRRELFEAERRRRRRPSTSTRNAVVVAARPIGIIGTWARIRSLTLA